MQLRTYVMVDRMQPQYAAFTGKRTLGMIPVEGDAQSAAGHLATSLAHVIRFDYQ